MLLTISTTHCPASDLGYLLHKNPGRLQREELGFGSASVFYPESSAERCTVALLVTVDPIALVRGRGSSVAGTQLEQYVNDRPYAANSFLSVAMGRIFGTAMSGRSKERQELADTPIPLSAHLPVIAARGGEEIVRRIFEPLGYEVQMERDILDDASASWGDSPYVSLRLSATVRLQDLLAHLYVLIPVLDNKKHYWISAEEIDKLLRRGDGWLGTHPEKELIVSRYLQRKRSLALEALNRLLVSEASEEEVDEGEESTALRPQRKQTLHEERLETVAKELAVTGSRRVLDLGCGSGKLLRLLLAERQFEFILGMDVSWRSIEVATDRLHLDMMSERQRSRIQLIHGSLTYRDKRLEGFDAAAIVEVIEHLDAARLATFERMVFEFARPQHIVLTTPNAEYNVVFEKLHAGEFRHEDHRFEWTREQFQQWAATLCSRFGYAVRFEDVGPVEPNIGAPTQMGVFTRL